MKKIFLFYFLFHQFESGFRKHHRKSDQKERKKTDKPNVIVILADDLGYNDMPWNNPAVIAPNFQKLAHQGTIMTDFYVQPVCTPSRSALMTSRKCFVNWYSSSSSTVRLTNIRYPIRFGLQTDVITAPQPSCLPLDETTLGQEMQSAGYRTHVGK